MQSVHNIPRELLDTLTLKSLRLDKPPPPDYKHAPNADSTDGAVNPGANIDARACNICLGVTFIDVDEQRIHFRSDWHRYNVKTRLSGRQAVSEEAFSRLVEALDDSLSGSASSSEEGSSEEDSSDAVTTLIKKTKRLGPQVNSEADDEASRQNKVPQSPIVWFNSPEHHTQLGIYRTIFPSYIESNMYLDELREIQSGGPDGRTWAMFMVAGGHFAGAIVKVGRSDEERKKEEEEAANGRKKKTKKPISETEVLRHKTFHRYTTRRKQGGSQSLNDNAKGPAKSAGALLRRYGEQALRDDIRNLLLDWAEDIDACERIWIRASTSNRRIFLDFEGLITKGDVRLRTFPFPTRRPTQSELARCLLELIKPKVSHLTEEELREQDEAYLASIKPKPPKPAPQPPSQQSQPLPLSKPKLTKDDEILKNKWIRAFDMISRDRLEAFKAFWDREADALGGINALIPEYAYADVNGNLKRAATFLQAAAAAGSEDILQWLLTDGNADPTVPVPAVCRDDDQDIPDDLQEPDGESVPLKPGGYRTAYDLSRTKVVRDIFRRCAATYPDKWDWFVAGRVPSGLSKQMEDERDERKKARRKGLKEKFKEREREATTKKVAVGMVESIPEPPPASKPENKTGPQKLGGVSGATEGTAGLTPEMRARVERERRARAAEARLKALR